VRAAALANLESYAARLPDDPRYHAAQNHATPRRESSRLALFDCLSCNACVVACPNDAVFSLRVEPGKRVTTDLVIEGGQVRKRPARFELARDRQWAVFADFCNECGNCDTFCPEHGGPHQVKPRFFGSRESFEAAEPGDGFLIEEGGLRTLARFRGTLHELVREEGGARFRDEAIEVELDREHRVIAARARRPDEGHVLPLWRYHAMTTLRDAVLAELNPVAAAFLPAIAAGPRRPVVESPG
jgi:putative selenate reductase